MSAGLIPGRAHMNGLDWAVLIGYFGVMVAIGVWSHKRVDDVSDWAHEEEDNGEERDEPEERERGAPRDGRG